MINFLRIVIVFFTGLFVAAAFCSVCFYVFEKITVANLPQHAKNALRQDKDGVKLLAEALELAVDKKEGKVIKLSALRNREKVAEIILEAPEVADDVYEGITIPLNC